nr:hypothetical protein GCM10025732_12220 [Glycomyces mayteni]
MDVVHPSSHLITADGSELEGSLTVVFGEDFAEGEHDVTAVFDLAPSTGVVYWADSNPSYGGCGPDATSGLLHCAAEDADRTVDFSYMYAAEPEAAAGEYPYTITIAVDGETVLTVDETMGVVAPSPAARSSTATSSSRTSSPGPPPTCGRSSSRTPRSPRTPPPWS